MMKYFEIFKFNLKTKFAFKTDYIFSLFSYFIHVLVFSCLWNYILKDKLIFGYTKSDLIWYIIIGELILYTTTNNYIKISSMVKNGDITNMLTKPISFVMYIFAEEASSIVNFLINVLFASILGLLMAGAIHLTLVNVILFGISLILGTVMYILLQVFVGLLAFLTEENKAFYLIISKFTLLLVFTPLELFPEVFRNILKFLPTTYVSYPAGKIFVNFNLINDIKLVIFQIISLVVVLVVIYIVSLKGVKNINVNGG